MSYWLSSTARFYKSFEEFYSNLQCIKKNWKTCLAQRLHEKQLVSVSSISQISEFQVFLEIAANLFSLTKILSLIFQSPNLKLSKSFLHEKIVMNIVENIRINSTS